MYRVTACLINRKNQSPKFLAFIDSKLSVAMQRYKDFAANVDLMTYRPAFITDVENLKEE